MFLCRCCCALHTRWILTSPLLPVPSPDVLPAEAAGAAELVGGSSSGGDDELADAAAAAQRQEDGIRLDLFYLEAMNDRED